MTTDDLHLDDFLPYLLNNAAETTGRQFAQQYRKDFGLSRAQWRIMANLGSFGSQTATEICGRSYLEKSKVSRAVAGLETAGLLIRVPSPTDRRAEMLSLTENGKRIHAELAKRARNFQAALTRRLGTERAALLVELLVELSEPPQG